MQESTPFFRIARRSDGPLDDLRRFWSNLLKSDHLRTGTAQLQQLARSASEGDCSIRLLALVAGLALVVSAFFGFIQLFFQFQFGKAILEIYALLLGIIMILLETRRHFSSLPSGREEGRTNPSQSTPPPTTSGGGGSLLGSLFSSSSSTAPTGISHATVTHDPASATWERAFRSLYRYALFLKYVWGRGCVYVVAGTLQWVQTSWVDWCVGGFVVFVGITYMAVGYRMAHKLTQLRQSIAEPTLRTKFRVADPRQTGQLRMEQFATLTTSLGMTLSHRELEVAFLCMDTQDRGYITFDDFQTWWLEWEEGTIIV